MLEYEMDKPDMAEPYPVFFRYFGRIIVIQQSETFSC